MNRTGIKGHGSEATQLGRIGHFGLDSYRPSPERRHKIYRLRCIISSTTVREDHVIAAPGGLDDERSADAARATGYYRDSTRRLTSRQSVGHHFAQVIHPY